LALADFNGDRKIDLAVANTKSNNVSVLVGDGKGGFARATLLPVGQQPFAILADDVNADGHVDIVTANSASGDLSVLAGDGAGHFTPAVTYAAGKTPVALAALSFDGAATGSGGGARRDLAVLSNGT